MAIEAASSIRAAAADQREAVRVQRHELAVERAEWRRETRVEEAKAAIAARPTPADRAVETPQRAKPSSGGLLLDVLT